MLIRTALDIISEEWIEGIKMKQEIILLTFTRSTLAVWPNFY